MNVKGIIVYIYSCAVSKIRQFAMPGTCENLLGLVNSCVYYARQIKQIYQVLPYSVDVNAPREIRNQPWPAMDIKEVSLYHELIKLAIFR